MRPNAPVSELRVALLAQKSFFKSALLFSFFTNLLVMAPTFYMLEVYDRVVNSRSGMTLFWLTILAIGLYALMECLQWVRFEVLQTAARKFDAKIGERIFDGAFEAALRRLPGNAQQAFTDLRSIREFLASPALIALMDVPLAMLYIVVIFMISEVMGVMAVVGALIAVFLAYLTERDSQPALAAANGIAITAQNYAANSLRNAQVIEAMGMLAGIEKRWLTRQNRFLFLQARASDAAGGYASISKFLQLAQSSLLLGVGCWLSLKGSFAGGGGMMIVASTLGARALSPITQVIGMWKQVVNARDAHNRLGQLLHAIPTRSESMPLPPPKGLLSVEQVVAAAPNSSQPIIKGVSFIVPPGQALAIVGPTAAGKSTLARLTVGIWPSLAGKVRLDLSLIHI